MTSRLANGTPVLIRPIRPDDKALLADGLAHLSADSIRLRFMSPKPTLSSSELRYLTEVDGSDHVAFVAVLADDPAQLAGVGRWVRLAEDPSTAEVAIVVGDPYQRQGLGRRLGALLADAARERGVARFSATMLAENVAAHRLFEAISQRLDMHRAGAVDELVAELAA
jgi:RimJ/RimL family protein N-acetyltransferase